MINKDTYKRLTEKTIGCFQYDLKNFNHKIGEFNDYDAFFAYSMAVKRLAELEDKIENGTLFESYCKVGDMLYEVIEGMPIQEWKVESITFNRIYPKGVIWVERTSDFAHWKFWLEDCGIKLFATKDQAEARLKELKGEK